MDFDPWFSRRFLIGRLVARMHAKYEPYVFSVTREFCKLEEKGVKINVVDELRFRLVTHYWIDDEAIVQTLDAFRVILK